jgi:ABC-2 type transport system permease protein
VKQSFYSLLLLLDWRFGSLWARLHGWTFRRGLRLLLMLSFGVILFLTIYRIELYVLGYLMGLPELGKLVIARFLDVAFLLFFFALIVSSAFAAHAVLYRDEELRFLFSLSLSEGVIFVVKFVEVMIYGSWTAVLFAVPFVMAYAAFIEVNWLTFWALFYGLLLPLVLISGCIGMAGVMMARWLQDLIPRRRLLWGLAGAVTVGAVAVLLALVFSASPERKGLSLLFSQMQFGDAAGASLAPHDLMSQGFFSILENRYGEFRRVISTLLGLCALTILLTLDMGKVLYFRSWQAGRVLPMPPPGKGSPGRMPARPLSFLENNYAALVSKDLSSFLRHPAQWSQIFLFAAAWLVYMVSFINLPRFFDLREPFWQILFFYINFGFACYFAALLGARFVFPFVGLEGRAFALLRTTPLGMDSFLWAKFWEAFLPVFLLTGSMVIVGNVVLQIHLGIFLASLISIFLATFMLTALALGSGAAFARFRNGHPAQIANSVGGAFSLFLGLTTATLICVIFAWPTYLYYKFTTFAVIFPLTEWITTTILMVALGITLSLFPMRIGLKALHRDLIL